MTDIYKIENSFFTECDGHTYGLECKQRCGNCSDNVQCDHVTGNCTNGCNVGVYGDKCDIGNINNFFLLRLITK